jgi:hypothetical protein
MRHPALALALALPLAVACKARDGDPAPTPTATPAAPAPMPDAPPSDGTRYALVVQFFSPGGGVDADAVAALDRHLAGLASPPQVVRRPWGEEGERDYCFVFPPQSPAERTASIDAIRAAVAASKQVNIYLDHACSPPDPTLPIDGPTAPAPSATVYGLVVSFYSPGDGADGAAIAAFDAYLATAEGDLELERVRWGEEGEIDYCLKLSKLTPAEKAAFVDGARKAVAGSKKVNVYPDAACSNKR